MNPLLQILFLSPLLLADAFVVLPPSSTNALSSTLLQQSTINVDISARAIHCTEDECHIDEMEHLATALSQIDYKCKEDQPSTMIVCEDFDIHCQVLEADGRDAVIRVLELKRELKVLLETKVKNSAFVKSVANQRGDDHSWFNDYMYYHM